MNELDCKDIKALLSGIIDDELDAPTRHLAERHIAACDPCRQTVDEAERLNQLLTLDAQRSLWPAGLPAGFESAVLRQTVYAEAFDLAGRRWTSWAGWIAAAACVLLTVTLWLLDQARSTGSHMPPSGIARVDPPRNAAPSGDDVYNAARTAAYAQNSLAGRSWTFDGSLPYEFTLAGSRRPAELSDDQMQAIDAELGEYMPAAWTQPQDPAHSPLSVHDSDTLFATSNLLDMLQHADVRTFSDVERIRQIAEYDDILDRLAESRQRLAPADRPALLAAESVLARVVHGPISVEDLHVLRETVASLNLPTQIDHITQRAGSTSSL